MGASLSSTTGATTAASSATAPTSVAADGYTRVDLGLPFYKLPTALGPSKKVSYREAVGELWAPGSRSIHKIQPQREDPFSYRRSEGGSAEPAALKAPPPPEVTPAVGTVDEVQVAGDSGLFGTVFEAWAHHAVLRTCPEDWWCVLTTRVAATIDRRAACPDVKALFVPGAEKKQTLEVEVLCPQGIYSDVYEELFDGFSAAIAEKIAVPGYTAAVTADFSTTTPVQRLGSQITLLTSFQSYFDYHMAVCGCGIAAVEMRGSAADWARLGAKLAALKQLLAPVEQDLELSTLFAVAESVFENLHRTFVGVDGQAMRTWWSKVLYSDPDIEYGPSGMRKGSVEAYNGWLVGFMLGAEGGQLKAKKLAAGEYAKELTCLSSAPMRIIDKRNPAAPVADDSIVAAGIMGYRVHARSEGPVALEPAHGWVLMLPANSPLRRG